jgi:hypothetical protein
MAMVLPKKAAPRVDQIREVQRSLNLKPYQSQYRVAVCSCAFKKPTTTLPMLC